VGDMLTVSSREGDSTSRNFIAENIVNKIIGKPDI
jgi:hypothetical protein